MLSAHFPSPGPSTLASHTTSIVRPLNPDASTRTVCSRACQERDGDFLYLALERCECTLTHRIEKEGKIHRDDEMVRARLGELLGGLVSATPNTLVMMMMMVTTI